MIIRNIDGISTAALFRSIQRWFDRKQARFDVKASIKNDNINIEKVRLRISKKYCGNHPSGCEVGNPHHRKAKFLEGADWVQFNDELNTILDRLNVGANIASALVIVRKGRMRRISYGHHYPNGFRRNAEWLKDEPDVWQNHCKEKAETSDFCTRTPGRYRKAGHSVVG